MLPFDLHVLGLPPAFTLSQDQTLHLKLLSPKANALNAERLTLSYTYRLQITYYKMLLNRTSARWTACPSCRRPHKSPAHTVKELRTRPQRLDSRPRRFRRGEPHIMATLFSFVNTQFSGFRRFPSSASGAGPMAATPFAKGRKSMTGNSAFGKIPRQLFLRPMELRPPRCAPPECSTDQSPAVSAAGPWGNRSSAGISSPRARFTSPERLPKALPPPSRPSSAAAVLPRHPRRPIH